MASPSPSTRRGNFSWQISLSDIRSPRGLPASPESKPLQQNAASRPPMNFYPENFDTDNNVNSSSPRQSLLQRKGLYNTRSSGVKQNSFFPQALGTDPEHPMQLSDVIKLRVDEALNVYDEYAQTRLKTAMKEALVEAEKRSREEVVRALGEADERARNREAEARETFLEQVRNKESRISELEKARDKQDGNRLPKPP